MPAYDYRCKQCGSTFELFYRTYTDYDAAASQRACPVCGSSALDRLIRRVTVAATGERDFAGMSSGEMLKVLENANPSEVNALYSQTGADRALNDTALRPLVERAVEKKTDSA